VAHVVWMTLGWVTPDPPRLGDPGVLAMGDYDPPWVTPLLDEVMTSRRRGVGWGEWRWWRASKKIEMLFLTTTEDIIRYPHQRLWLITRTKSTAARLK
jgi:hypothetical protein